MKLRCNVLKPFNNMLLVRIDDLNVNRYEQKEHYTLLFQDEQLSGIQIEHFNSNETSLEVTPELVSFINEKTNLNLNHDYETYLVVGEVVKMKSHPHSDHLQVCQVNIGNEEIQIVCGAHNVRENLKVVVALENAIVQDRFIRKGQLLKVESNGMLCSAYELGLLSEYKKGLLELDESYTVGEPFVWKG